MARFGSTRPKRHKEAYPRNRAKHAPDDTTSHRLVTGCLPEPHTLARGLPIVQRIERLASMAMVTARLPGRAGQVRGLHPEDRVPSWLVAERAADIEQAVPEEKRDENRRRHLGRATSPVPVTGVLRPDADPVPVPGVPFQEGWFRASGTIDRGHAGPRVQSCLVAREPDSIWNLVNPRAPLMPLLQDGPPRPGQTAAESWHI